MAILSILASNFGMIYYFYKLKCKFLFKLNKLKKIE